MLPCVSLVAEQQYNSQCWNLSIVECVKAVAHCEKNPLPNDLSNNEMWDWLPLVSCFFKKNFDAPAHAVNSTTWPSYDKANGCGASMSHKFQYLKCYGTHFKKGYRYEQPTILANNFNLFSMKEFLSMRTKSPKRVFIDTYKIMNPFMAIPIVKNHHLLVCKLSRI